MDALKNARKHAKGTITRVANWVDSNIDSLTDHFLLESKVKHINDSFAKYDSTQNEIEDLDVDGSDTEDRQVVESQFDLTVAKINRKIHSLTTTQINLPQHNTSTIIRTIEPTVGVKLPQLSIPTYAGDYQKWTSFYQLFCSLIKNNQSLPDIQKFIYLKSYLVGEPLNLIESLELTNENFAIAIEILEKRYENNLSIINSHLNSIIDYPNVVKGTAQALREFQVNISKNIESLKNLKCPTDSWDLILINILLRKLDFNSKKHYQSNRDTEHTPSLSEFFEIIGTYSDILESLSSNMLPREKHSPKPIRKTTLHVNNFKEKKCFHCKSTSHGLYSCSNFAKMSLNDKYNFLKSERLCFNCMGARHMVSECKSKTCFCGKKHHSILHNDNTRQNNFPSSSSNANNSSLPRNNNSNVNRNGPEVSSSNSYINPAFSYPRHSNGSNDSRNHHLDNSANSQLQNVASNNNPSMRNSDQGQTHTSSVLSTRANSNNVLLATAVVTIYSKFGNPIQARAVLDAGSQTSFVTEQLCSKLNASTYNMKLQGQGVQQISFIAKKMTNLEIHSNSEPYKRIVACSVLETITSKLPEIAINVRSLNIPPHILLADANFGTPSEIDLLIGADEYYDLLIPEKIDLGKNSPNLVNTHLGWIVGGKLLDPYPCRNVRSFFLQSVESVPDPNTLLSEALAKFWETEEIPSIPFRSPEEQLAENHFLETHKRLENGRFQIDFPLKTPTEVSKLGESFQTAKKRFLNIEKRLHMNEKLLNDYSKFINEYVTLNHARYISWCEDESSLKYYIPHSCVVREDHLTTKLRVVFDASSKSSTGISLNDITLKGYQVQPDLFDILCRFRQYPFVLTADIEKMYRQIRTNPEQNVLQNILWRNSPCDPIQCIELLTVSYGTNFAPFVATRCLHQLAMGGEKEFPLAAEALKFQTYVDDVLCGSNSERELENSYYQLNTLLDSAGFHLHKWNSNSFQFREKFCTNNKSVDYEITNEKVSNKVLGLVWNNISDSFALSVPQFFVESSVTKRVALSTISKMYDPLGLVNPVCVIFKVYMQKLWIAKLSWDDPIKGLLLSEWHEIVNSLNSLLELKIPRQLFKNKPILRIELHGFADSSEKAYGACVYFRTVYTDNMVSCALVSSKSRVAPVKTISLPRLELSAMVLLVDLSQKIIDIFQNKISLDSINVWTDSQIALCWIQSHPSRWSTYVANRVSHIQKISSTWHWRHVKSAENPADILSRGSLPNKLIQASLWWHGPQFLSEPNKDLSQFNPQTSSLEVPEEKKITLYNIALQDKRLVNDFWYNVFLRFSHFSRLTHSIAYSFRFISNLKNPNNKQVGPITVAENENALNFIIRQIQRLYFEKEIFEIKANKQISNKNLLSLSPFLNKSEFLCVGGRLEHADIPETHKHPILLPANNHVVTLMLAHEHKRLGHAGAHTVLSNVRLKYWPLNGLNQIKKIIHNCLNCFRFSVKPSEQIMSDLPKDRVSSCRPFENVGVDFGGPFLVKTSNLRKAPMSKCYVAIFVCMATKAIHIELVSSLSTESFLLTLKRFIARRGNPSKIYSDNATNFLGAQNQLRELRDFFRNSEFQNSVKSFATETNIEWKFIPSHSPHWGGLWEAAIKSCKYHLRRIMGNAKLTFEELVTVLYQIEAILNSRPICPLSNDPSDLECLTPGHFLIGTSLTAYPEKNVTHLPDNRLAFWQRCSQLQQHFWNRWSREYLNLLQNKPKWLNPTQNLAPNDLVLLKEDNIPPLKWPRARILEILPGRDGKVRAIRLKTTDTILTRPITKVCLLPSSMA